MTYAEVENTLNVARDCAKEIVEKRAALDEARSIVESMVPRPRGDAGVSMSKDPHSKMETYLITAERLENEIHDLYAIKVKAMDLIGLIDDRQRRSIMFGYYINCLSWPEVSEHQHMEHFGGTVYYHRHKAIEEIAEKTSQCFTV